MRRQHPFISFFTIIFCVFIAFANCRGKPTKKTSDKSRPIVTEPAAEIKQSVVTPTLAPPSKTAPAAEQTTAIPRPELPKGPTTVLTPPTETPTAPDEQQLPAPQPLQGGAQLPSLAPPPQAPIPTPPPIIPTAPAATPSQSENTVAPPGLAAPLADVAQQPVADFVSQTPQPPTTLQTNTALPSTPILPSQELLKPEQAQPVGYEPKLVQGHTDIDIIVDASGSMSAPFGTINKTKLDMVRDALYDIVFEMLSQQKDFPRNIGIGIFGTKSPISDGNRLDSEQLISMGEPNLDGVKSLLSIVKAQGLSPISLALTDAAKSFPAGATADRVIVLIADGADNTESDACAAARQLESGAIKTTIHVVAFDVSPDDLPQLECVAKTGDGKFFLARNEAELRSSLDQAINSTIPYNLKLSALAGGIPLPFDIAIFRAGGEQAFRRDKSYGTKLLRLDPGSYDILVEYSESPEKKKPSKILKGVEILSTTKVEQTVSFDLAPLMLSAAGGNGAPAAARFEVTLAGTTDLVAQVESGMEPKTIFIAPGKYDVTTDLLESQLEGFQLSEKNIEVKMGETTERGFLFQKGILSLKGLTTQKEAIPFIYQVFKTERPDQLIASGAFPAEGGSCQLAPGIYDLIVIGTDPKMAASPRTKVSAIEIRAASATDIVANFEMGMMKLSATDGKDNKLPAIFVVRDHDNQMEMTRVASENGDPVQIPIPPGTYDIVASSLKSTLEPKPSVPISGVVVTADKPVDQVIKFILGTLKLRGRNAKEQALQTQFTIYKAASDEVVTTTPASSDWMIFDLAPGRYDALATNNSSSDNPKPMIWLRDLQVEDGKITSHEAIFTAGRLKIIGRGPNNEIIPCTFKVFQYGKDRELISGTTSQDWDVFEIQPGKYYLEAGYHDDEQSVLLKQWVSLSVGENEVVEVVLRF